MDITVLDPQFKRIGDLDHYDSLLWVPRYNKCGDFELIVPASIELAEILAQDNYLWIKEFPDVYMIIERFYLRTNSEDGDTILVSGRTINSILDRRCIFPQTTVSGNVQDAMAYLVEHNIGVSADTDRRVDNLIVVKNNDAHVADLGGLRAQFTGDNLLESISAICEQYGLGFRIVIRNNKLVFSLYCGIDRSTAQSDNPRVVFSKDFESLLDSSLSSDQSRLKNVAIVQGSGTGSDRTTEILNPLSATGLSRRELYVDARDISSYSYDPEAPEIDPEEYSELLLERGAEKLLEHIPENIIEATPIPQNQYIFGTDYNLGDIVQIENQYGVSVRARVIEVIFSDDENGRSYNPAFELLL